MQVTVSDSERAHVEHCAARYGLPALAKWCLGLTKRNLALRLSLSLRPCVRRPLRSAFSLWLPGRARVTFIRGRGTPTAVALSCRTRPFATASFFRYVHGALVRMCRPKQEVWGGKCVWVGVCE